MDAKQLAALVATVSVVNPAPVWAADTTATSTTTTSAKPASDSNEEELELLPRVAPSPAAVTPSATSTATSTSTSTSVAASTSTSSPATQPVAEPGAIEALGKAALSGSRIIASRQDSAGTYSGSVSFVTQCRVDADLKVFVDGTPFYTGSCKANTPVTIPLTEAGVYTLAVGTAGIFTEPQDLSYYTDGVGPTKVVPTATAPVVTYTKSPNANTSGRFTNEMQATIQWSASATAYQIDNGPKVNVDGSTSTFVFSTTPSRIQWWPAGQNSPQVFNWSSATLDGNWELDSQAPVVEVVGEDVRVSDTGSGVSSVYFNGDLVTVGASGELSLPVSAYGTTGTLKMVDHVGNEVIKSDFKVPNSSKKYIEVSGGSFYSFNKKNTLFNFDSSVTLSQPGCTLNGILFADLADGAYDKPQVTCGGQTYALTAGGQVVEQYWVYKGDARADVHLRVESDVAPSPLPGMEKPRFTSRVVVDFGNHPVPYESAKIIRTDTNEVIGDFVVGKPGVEQVLDPGSLSDGSYNVRLELGLPGNDKLSIDGDHKVLVDLNPPTVQLTNPGEIVTSGSETFYKGALPIKVKFADKGYGLTHVVVRHGNEVVGEYNNLPGTEPVKEWFYDITELGGDAWTFEVADGNHPAVVKTLSELLGVKGTNVTVDSHPPILEVNPEGSYKLVNGVQWVTKDQTLTWKIVDPDGHLSQATVTIGGQEYSDPTGVITVPVSSLPEDKLLDVKVSASDRAKNTYNEKFQSFRVAPDKVPVSVSVDGLEGSVVRGSDLIAKQDIRVKMTTDHPLGIASYDPQGEGLSWEAPYLTLRDISSGKMVLKDGLGRVQEFSLGTLVGDTRVERVIVDREPPKVEDLQFNEWYRDRADLPKSIHLTDDRGLAKVVVRLNNEVVLEKELDTDTADVPLTWDVPDGHYEVRVDVTDIAGRTAKLEKKFSIDSTPPKVERFEITNPEWAPGADINGSDVYGFWVQGATRVRVHVTDPEVSSGLDSVSMTLREDGRGTRTVSAPISGGSAVFEIPSGFKGFISAVAYDRMQNESPSAKPDGIVSGNGNTQINRSDLSIQLPSPVSKDATGDPLYSDRVDFNIVAKASHAGIRYIQYGLDGTTLGEGQVDASGRLSSPFHVDRTDHNLVTEASVRGDIRNQLTHGRLWVKVTDATGFTSETETFLSVDTDTPRLDLSWDVTNPSGGYNTPRVATLTVVDHNFDPSKLDLQGTTGAVGTWRQVGDTWTLPIVVDKDGVYDFTATVTDRVGKKSNSVSSGKFIIDRTAPTIKVDWSDNSPMSNQARTATIIVDDVNFDPALVKVDALNGIQSTWLNNGTSHSMTVRWPSSGPGRLSVSATDAAGNAAAPYTSNEFVLDFDPPKVDVVGVTPNTVYTDKPRIRVSYQDAHPAPDSFKATVVGRKGKTFELPVVWSGGSAQVLFDSLGDGPEFDDLYTLKVVARDAAGNAADTTVSFIVNRYGSNLKAQGVDMAGKFLKEAEDVLLQQVSVEKLDPSKFQVRVTRDGAAVSIPENSLSIVEHLDESVGWVYDLKVARENFHDEGMYAVQVFSQTESGRADVPDLQYNFVVDRTAPGVVITGVENNARYRATSRDVTITARDATDTTVKVLLNGDEIIPSGEGVEYKFTARENSRVQYLQVVATDSAGNVSDVRVDDFLVTTSWWAQLKANVWLWWVSAIAVLLVGVVGATLLRLRRDK